MKQIEKSGVIASAFMAALSLSVMAQAETPPAKPEVKHCIDLAWLDRSEVVDDQTILFYMKGGKIYENKLPYKCHGLRFEDGFSFATSIHQLCNTDIIKVLRRGNACGLGDFTPYEKPKKAVTPPETPASDATKK